jgi:hypothetical protein
MLHTLYRQTIAVPFFLLYIYRKEGRNVLRQQEIRKMVIFRIHGNIGQE